MIKNRDQNRLNVVYVHASSIANQQINRFVQTQTLIKKSNVSLCFQGILTVSCILHNYWCQVDSVTYQLIVTSVRFSIAGDQLYYWEVVFFSACALSLCCVQVLASFFRAFFMHDDFSLFTPVINCLTMRKSWKESSALPYKYGGHKR